MTTDSCMLFHAAGSRSCSSVSKMCTARSIRGLRTGSDCTMGAATVHQLGDLQETRSAQ